MKRVSSIIVFLLAFQATWMAQIEFLTPPYDLGVISSRNNGFVDVPVKNTGTKKVYIFRADVDRRFSIRYSNKTIMPDSTIYIRVKFNPKKKGYVSEKIPVHFSCFDEPLIMKIEGFVEEIPKSNDIACPSFDKQQVNTPQDFALTITVIDAVSKEPLSSSEVKIIHNGLLGKLLTTKRNGSVTQKVPIGYYYFVAGHEGYFSSEKAAYVNKNNNQIIIPLSKKEEELIVSNTPDQEQDLDEEIAEVVEAPDQLEEETVFEEGEDIMITIEDPIDTEEVVISEEVKEINQEETPPYVPENDPYPDFSLREYRPNNIVFLVDVSSSMRYQGKLDILKASMIELTSILRPSDKISLVGYSSKATILLETTSATDVDSIINIISNLDAKGMTAGSQGMELAYVMACNAMIAEGNNEIIMATDGAFNTGETNVYKLARKYNKKGVKVSVVGIKNKKFDKESMRKLAEEGGGSYIDMRNYEDGRTMLIEEIKNSSRIEKGQ